MDEILRQKPKRSSKTPAKAKESAVSVENNTTERMLDAAVLARRKVRRAADVVDEKLGHARFQPILFLSIAALLSVLLVVSTVYTPAYLVRLNGVRLGLVSSTDDVERVVDRVEARASRVLGYDYTLAATVTYEQALAQKEDLVVANEMESDLFSSISEITNSYVLRVGGEIIGSWTDEAELQAMLDSIAAPYVTENTISTSFAERVHVSYELIPSDSLQDLNAIFDVLTENTTGETTYEAVKGDTYSAIAFNNGMSLDELMALNPDRSIDKLMIGDVINVKEIIPFLSVQTVDHVTYHTEIACPVEKVEDSSMYIGDSKVITPGIKGEALVTADISYTNGVEKARDILSEEVLSEPTVEVVAVGTKVRPRTLPTGSLIWPIRGTITSYFGSRYIFGSYSYHHGLDIANAAGTPIAAADGGTVVFAGWQNNVSGYKVIIDHGSGVKTAYAHCSSVAAYVGQEVYQGQTIAYVGRTGTATGNHVHFEVFINGTAQNPLRYLP